MAKEINCNIKKNKNNTICKQVNKLTGGSQNGYVNAKNGLFAFNNGNVMRLSKKYTKNKTLISLAEDFASK